MVSHDHLCRQTSRSPESWPANDDVGAVEASLSRQQSDLPATSRGSNGSSRSMAEAMRILDDVRAALRCNPKDAREGARQLLTLLSESLVDEAAIVHGGLAPWQKRRIDRYLVEHLHESLEVGELARQVFLSVSYFHRAFKKTFGATPRSYVARLRLRLAEELLLTTGGSLAEIALASGLADHSHLCKLFRRELGETPSGWRKRNLVRTRVDGHAEPSHLNRTGQPGPS